MMLSISPLMTVVALLILPISWIIIKVVIKYSQGHFHDQQRFLGEVNGHVEEMYAGHTIIKAFGREKQTTAEFDEINENLRNSAWKSQFFSSLMMPLTAFVGNLGYVAMCILGGYLAFNNVISIGNIQTFLLYVRNLNNPVQTVANVMNLLQSTAAAAERIFELIEEEEEEDAFGSEDPSKIKFDAVAHKGEVSFRNVKFGYVPGETVIEDFDYVAKPGSRVAIVGHTGAGKTTIVKLLMRYYELDGGDIFIDHHDIKDYSRSDLRALFGMVMQDAWLFSGTIRDNIRYGTPDATEDEIIAAAKAAHIHHYITTLPQGYDTVINEEASNISQGQKQLLTIARAMLADNPILILDEATSSVDTRTERIIQSAMANLMKGRTSFVIAHRLSTIKDADHILVMANGGIVEQGSHEELLADDGYYAHLYNSQFS
jgi:ATP-binding cassette subfamily B protein